MHYDKKFAPNILPVTFYIRKFVREKFIYMVNKSYSQESLRLSACTQLLWSKSDNDVNEGTHTCKIKMWWVKTLTLKEITSATFYIKKKKEFIHSKII